MMAALVHPMTGIEMNPINIERKALSFDDAVTAHLLRMQGVKYNIIVQRLGTNTHRVGEVFRGEKHAGSRELAQQLFASSH